MEKDTLKRLIGLPDTPPACDGYTVLAREEKDGYAQLLIEYTWQGNAVHAYLLLPPTPGPAPAVLALHQHNAERHLGKSEVCGLCGDPLQAFGPALARRGIIVLAPDSICFESRRPGATGTTPLPGDGDYLQHLNAMAYRLLEGDTLLRTVLMDAMAGISLLAGLPDVDPARLGVVGHSYGGSTALFLMAADARLRYGCASGSACTWRNRMAHGVGIEFSSVIPGLLAHGDLDDIVPLIAPTRLLVVSSDDDRYTRDADIICARALAVYTAQGVPERFAHRPFAGGHALTRERFDCIVDWLAEQAFPPDIR